MYKELKQLAESRLYPFHMPGHKRQLDDPYLGSALQMDVTEIDGFDNLHHPTGIIRELEQRLADFFQADRARFLVNGSTSGVLAAISAVMNRPSKGESGKEGGITKSDRRLLMARNSHKSAYDSAYLNRLDLRFLMPEEIPLWQINGGISPAAVEEALAEDPCIEGVFLTSPTYEGILSDIGAISSICHRKGLPLIVDSAHGAHLGLYNPFTEKFRCPDAFAEGADLVIESLHKTLPSFNQTAVILYREDLIDPHLIERFTSLFQTTSPSYVFMAGADKCLDIMEKQGEALFHALDHRLSKLKDQVRDMRHVRIFEGEGMQKYSGYGLDPTKLLISADGMTGRDLYDFLRQEHDLQPEMASKTFCLAMTTVMDSQEGFSRLTKALVHLEEMLENDQDQMMAPRGIQKTSGVDSPKRPGEDHDIEKDDFHGKETVTDKLLPSAMTIFEALSHIGIELPLTEAEGRISGTYVYAFPPDIPLLIPGDIISRAQIQRITAMESSGILIHGIQEGKILCTE